MSFSFDNRWLDVDFRNEKPWVFGVVEEPKELFSDPVYYEDVETVMTESEMRAAEERERAENSAMDNLVSRIMNQGQEGSCVYNMLAQLLEVMQAAQFGLEHVTLLSAISGYQLNARSASSGSTVNGAMAFGRDTGLVPLDNEANRARYGNVVMPHTGFRAPRPAGWQDVAKEFRGDEVLVFRTVAGMRTALLRKHPVGVGRSGHSILHIRAMWENGQWIHKYPNSWNITWGDQGYGYDSTRAINASASWCFTYRTIVWPDWLLKLLGRLPA